MAKSARNSLFGNKVGDICFTLMLDPRHEYENGVRNIALRMTEKMNRTYFNYGEQFTPEEFCKIVKSSEGGRPGAVQGKNAREWYNMFSDRFDYVLELAGKLLKAGRLSREDMKKALGGQALPDHPTGPLDFLELWDQVIQQQKNAGTRQNYQRAKESFVKFAGGRVTGFEVDGLIREWDAYMRENLALATVGIRERACRVVLNEAINLGLMDRDRYPFGRSRSKIQIPKGATRKADFLPVEDMTRLYEFFLNPSYPKEWQVRQKMNHTHAVGMFLAQYLCNGFNLADAARLEYTDDYIGRKDKCLRFMRHKTKDRAEEASEVIIPVIPPLQKILDYVAAVPRKGCLVFPYIIGAETNEDKIVELIATENRNIRKRVGRVCKLLGMDVSPSSTWARHSFATNLTHRGVPQRYISESMGHAIDKDITARYIQTYPYETQVRFNSLLLNLGQERDTADQVDASELRDMLKGVSMVDLETFLASLKK